MNNGNLISFIVPVYNVEKYIEDCVNSIINQTYNNIEIILVDDGSKDNSSYIIDELAKKDDRTRVFHKKNGGVSSARNFGLKKAKGEVILFVDGDDTVEPEYAQYFNSLLKNNKCDIAVNFDFYSVHNVKYNILDNYVDSNDFVLEKMYYGDLNVAVWNKAYRKDFLIKNNIIFDENIWFGEGMLFNTKCFQYCSKIAVGNKKVYHQRWNSESAMRKFNLESNLCGIKSLYLQKELWIKPTSDIEKAWEYHLRCFNRSILVGILKSGEKKTYYEEYKKCKKNLRKNLKLVLSSKISKNRKIYYIAMAIFPDLIAYRDIKKEKKYNSNLK